VYVQDRLAEAASLVWSLLQAGAHFYVCGDAASMAPAVEAALLGVIRRGLEQEAQQAQLVEEQAAVGSSKVQLQAEAYLAALSEAGRYERDVWF
jgi:sulfite reductase (NADPH) flavoprotein alpha-component